MACLALSGCRGSAVAPDARVAFTDVTRELGLGAPFATWREGSYAPPEIMGGGVAAFDHDGDGDVDLYEVRQPPPHEPGPAPNRLWERLADGTFVDATAATGLGDTGFGQGVAVGDVDGDGDLDVHVLNHGPDAFYRNEGDGRFVEATAEHGLSDDAWSVSAAFCDVDRDGDLDLHVARYLDLDPSATCLDEASRRDYCGPDRFPGLPDVLYLNDGRGRFRDATVEAGLQPAAGGRRSKGLGVACVDMTADGWPDILVANDGEPNHLWVNDGDGTFTEDGVLRGLAVNARGAPEASMGVAVGDVNGDGFVDVVLTHLAGETDTLYLGRRSGAWEDRTDGSGLARASLAHTGFGCALADLDHDGHLDLVVTNGRVRRTRARVAASRTYLDAYGEPGRLHRGGQARLMEPFLAGVGSLAASPAVGRGLAVTDIDDDGDLDVIVNHLEEGLRIHRNDWPAEGTHWLLVRAVTGGRDAVGARVSVEVGARRLERFILSGTSYGSTGDFRAHFGLGEADRIDALSVTWPDGRRERFEGGPADRVVTVRQGGGRS